MKTPESLVLQGCLKYLKIKGIFAWRNSVGAVRIGPGRFMRFGLKGSSDIVGILPGGRLLCVECKSQNGRLSEEQRAFLETVRGLGGLALTVKSWQELDKALREEKVVNDGPLFGA